MSRPRMTPTAEEDLFSLNREYFSIAVQAIHRVAAEPGIGVDVPLVQFQIDPTLRPPLKQYQQKTGTGYRVYIYYWPQGNDVWIEQIHLVAMM